MPGCGAVDIIFKDDALERLCTEERVAKKKLGTKSAKKLLARLADLMAAERMIDVVFGRPHQLKGDLAGCMAFDLDKGCRLVVEVANDPVPARDDGGIDWACVDTVRVVFIGDYHD